MHVGQNQELRLRYNNIVRVITLTERCKTLYVTGLQRIVHGTVFPF
jgi:hypothetical protein